ncbi:(2Fe-2S)-binding protein [Leucobacter viscericola]|uniref:(2Fe-2S)-binding protein n=1 Tax=Leucobacter viscericola TaxID=2714935 RepID=A0A6G7XIH8_9MICO|nr:(2Fe-2S)-binding protein [Leucobacter viscericola]QIK64286.1 (2Fe-2S)-binding protein [Leucobacter viscericola]
MNDTPAPNPLDEAAAPAAPVQASFCGEPITAETGASVAAALLASGRPAWRTTRDGKPRGLFCGIGVCFDCIVEIDGESGQRACMIPLREGMEIRPVQTPSPSPSPSPSLEKETNP